MNKVIRTLEHGAYVFVTIILDLAIHRHHA